MATARKLRKAMCKICGYTCRRPTSGECIKAIHAHYVKKHPNALSRKIKKGMKSSRASSHNPAWFRSIMSGVFPPAVLPSIVADYRSMSPGERTFVKTILRAITPPIGAEASAIGEVVIRALDKAIG